MSHKTLSTVLPAEDAVLNFVIAGELSAGIYLNVSCFQVRNDARSFRLTLHKN
jgi:hypothetical protein